MGCQDHRLLKSQTQGSEQSSAQSPSPINEGGERESGLLKQHSKSGLHQDSLFRVSRWVEVVHISEVHWSGDPRCQLGGKRGRPDSVI